MIIRPNLAFHALLSRHPELVSGSVRARVGMLKQVQHDEMRGMSGAVGLGMSDMRISIR